MAERALIFTAAEIRGLQRAHRGEPGGKFQTRQILKPQPEQANDPVWANSWWWKGVPIESLHGGGNIDLLPIQPGDIVRAKHGFYRFHPSISNPENEQAWDSLTRCVRWPSGQVVEDCEPELLPQYAVAGTIGWQKCSPMFMPRWASRYWMRITSVRVERVNDITEAEAEAEGITGDEALVGQISNPYRTAYADWFDQINGDGSWDANPWVAVYQWEAVTTEAPKR